MMTDDTQPQIPEASAMIFSAAGHVVALLLLIFGLPSLWDDEPRDTIIPVAVVADIGEISQSPNVSDKSPVKKPDPTKPVQENKTPKTPKPAEKPTQTAPKTASPPPPTPETTTPPQPDKPAPAPAPTQTAAETPAPPDQSQQKPQTQPKPTPPEKPKPPKPQQKPQQQTKPDNASLDSLLNDVSNLPDGEKTQEKPNPTQQAAASDYNPAPTAPVYGEKLTASEEDAIRAHVEQCWNLDTGMKDVETFKVGIRIALTPDGTVTGAEIVERGQLGNPYFRAFAESGLRAVQRCSPLPVPHSKPYETWQTMTLNFYAKDLIGY